MYIYIYIYIYSSAWEKIITYKKVEQKRKSSNMHVVKNNLVENMNTNSPK